MLDFCLVHLEAFRRNNITQILYTSNMKQALGGLSKEVIGSESGKNSGHMSEMFFFRFGKDHNIIQINHNINIKKIIKNIIDKVLKRGRSIGEPKRHNQILIAAIFSSKSCQMFITLLDSEQVVCPRQSILLKIEEPLKTLRS